VPERARALDDSAAGVQVLDGIHQSGHCLNQGKRFGPKRRVSTFEPCPGHAAVAADDGVKRSIKTDEQHRKLEGFLIALQGVVATSHARDRSLRYSDQIGERLAGHPQLLCRPERSLCHNGRFRSNGNWLGSLWHERSISIARIYQNNFLGKKETATVTTATAVILFVVTAGLLAFP